jgi:hypothetical protein
MIHHIRTSCRRSAAHTDGGHPMLVGATVLEAPAVQQEVRSSGDKKVEDARESSEQTFLPSDLLGFCDPTRTSR